MMSAAIPVMAGVEQTKVRPMSGDLFSGSGELEDVSFAESFSERIGMPSFSQANGTANDLTMTPPGLKGTKVVKAVEEVTDKSLGVKEKPSAAQEITVQAELKGAGAGRIIRSLATTVAGSQDKITADDARTTQAEFPAQVEETADDVSSIPYASASETTPVSPRPSISIADGDQPSMPLVLGGGATVFQKESKAAEEVTEGASLKKAAKAQENSATQKIVQKAVGKILDAIVVEPKVAMGVSTENASPIVAQVVAPTVALHGEVIEAPGASNRAVSSVTTQSTETSPLTAAGQVRKESASGPKASGTDTAVTVAAGSDAVASPKAYLSPEKMLAVAMPDASDGEKKAQAVRESGAAVLHSMGLVPTAGVSGNTAGGVAPTKTVVGDARFHTEGLLTASREQDEAGVVAQSMDGLPRMLASTPTSLEVGIQNGTHGWLKVRAEMADGGVVNASVSASSSAGQEMLHRELPAMTAFLQEEKVAVNTIIVHTPSAGADARSFSGADATGGQTSQRSNQGEEQQQDVRKATLNRSDETMASLNAHGTGEDGSLPLAANASGGSWLSVRA